MDDDIAQENVPTTSDDMQTEEFDKQHMPTQTNEDLQQLSSDVAAFRTEDVEKNVMDEVEKAIEKQEHKRGQKYLDDLSKLRKEMEEIGMVRLANICKPFIVCRGNKRQCISYRGRKASSHCQKATIEGIEK